MSLKQTPLFQKHVDANGKMVDFSGWHLPIHYGSQVNEHQFVRESVGLFDVSHMTIVDLAGAEVRDFLRFLVANDIAKLDDGQALYTCMLTEQAGIIDDLIVYRKSNNAFRLIVNAATRENDMAWINKQASQFQVEVTERPELSMIAIQGPEARDIAHQVLPSALVENLRSCERFQFAEHGSMFVARTGYTGEDGYEIALPADEAESLWDQLLSAGAKPCGLGARDTLRLEAGMALYGQDMDTSVTPYEAGLAWTVSLKDKTRNFLGRVALEAQKAEGIPHKTVGLILEQRGVLRHGMTVLANGEPVGELTSGSFSPTLKTSIAIARIKTPVADALQVQVRDKALDVKQVKPPFISA